MTRFRLPERPQCGRLRRTGKAWLLAAALALPMIGGQARAQDQPGVSSPAPGGPVQLRQPSGDVVQERSQNTGTDRAVNGERQPGEFGQRGEIQPRQAPQAPPKLSEFEQYVNRLAAPNAAPGTAPLIRRLGANLMTGSAMAGAAPGAAIDYSPLVPSDYLVSAGDEIVLTMWGSVDANLRVIVDRSGRISIPRVGSILVSGVRYADLPDTIRQRVALVFKNFHLSVALGQLRGVRVYVTGFVTRPGGYTVNALSSIANVLVRAGGPAEAGSFRDIELKRGGRTVSTLDFYDLLLKGDRASDKLVQADDVIHVGPIGPQVAVIGSVNRPAIYELKPGETLRELLPMTGGFSPVADRTRFALERVDDHATVRVTQLRTVNAAAIELQDGDVLRAFNAVDLATAVDKQNKRVRVEGEVLHPGDYVLPPNSTMSDALQAAGGLTPRAYVFGASFTRESVRITQQENYERALRDLETQFERSSSTQRVTSSEEAAAAAGRSAATSRLIARLRAVKPTGRVVLQLQPDSRQLPNLLLEDGDQVSIPPAPTSVGVFGSVFNAGSYLSEGGMRLSDYINLAGGPTRGADAGSTFVIRANGSVVSNLQSKGWFGGLQGNFEDLPALPGDTLYVPEEVDKTTFVQYAKDWTQILAQFSLGAAAFVTLTK